jgi:hypothetical protein
MPDAISSLQPSFCNSEIASCEESPLPAAKENRQAMVVELEPVVVTGDAGAQELLLNCQDGAAALASSAAQAVGGCHDRGGTVSAGESRRESRHEIICEVER